MVDDWHDGVYSMLVHARRECNETLNFVALNLKRVPNFSPEEIDLTSMLERRSKIERRVENVEETCSLTMVEQINTNEKVQVMQNYISCKATIFTEESDRMQQMLIPLIIMIIYNVQYYVNIMKNKSYAIQSLFIHCLL